MSMNVPRRLSSFMLGVLATAGYGCGADRFTSAADSGADVVESSPDAGGDASGSDAATDASADGGNTARHLTCGSTPCGPGEVCCAYTASAVDRFECRGGCQPAGGGEWLSVLSCTEMADCKMGAVCCIERKSTSNVSVCTTQCGSNQVPLCNPASADSGCAPTSPCSSTNITDWKLPLTFGTCGGQGVP